MDQVLNQLDWSPVWITPGIKSHDYYEAKAGHVTFRISPKFVRRKPGYIAELDAPGDRYAILEDTDLGVIKRFCSWHARAHGWI